MVEYLGTQFEQATKTLVQALDLCSSEQGACSPKLVAKLHRDLGHVLVTGLGRRDEALREFECARRLDPTIAIEVPPEPCPSQCFRGWCDRIEACPPSR